MVHPQCRGYVHRTAFIFNNLQNNAVLICALSRRTFLPKPYVHSATEVVHALSWDLTLNPKIDLSFFTSHHHHNTKPLLTPLHKFLFIQVHYYNTMGLNHGTFTKKGASTHPEAHKTILDCNSTYKLHTKIMELPKLRTFKVHAPTSP